MWGNTSFTSMKPDIRIEDKADPHRTATRAHIRHLTHRYGNYITFLSLIRQKESKAKEKLVADLKVVISDAEELLRVTANQAGEKVGELRVRMQENLTSARHKLADAEAALKEKSREVARATDDYVHEHPWKSIGVAADVGLLVGLLIGRR